MKIVEFGSGTSSRQGARSTARRIDRHAWGATMNHVRIREAAEQCAALRWDSMAPGGGTKGALRIGYRDSAVLESRRIAHE
jgi:hypothetical protein